MRRARGLRSPVASGVASTRSSGPLGKPIASTEEHHQRIGKPVALAVFASDAISSTAYATEEILLVLLVAVAFPAVAQLPGADRHRSPWSCWSSSLTSYRQTIHAYPDGGGAYVVCRGEHRPDRRPGRRARRCSSTTRSPSPSRSPRACWPSRSAVPGFRPDDRRDRALPRVLRVLMTVGNLRGLKESGKVFAVPTYLYVVLLLSLLIGRAHPGVRLRPRPDRDRRRSSPTSSPRSTRLAATAVAVRRSCGRSRSGAVVLSGVEAISNGVPAFRKPESKNAATTLMLHGRHPRRRLPRHRRSSPTTSSRCVDEGGETVLVPDGQGRLRRQTPLFYALPDRARSRS